MYVYDASLACAHIPAGKPQGLHAGQGQLPQVALLHAAADQGHGDVPLDAVHPHLQTCIVLLQIASLGSLGGVAMSGQNPCSMVAGNLCACTWYP